MGYDFSQLNDKEFEILSTDLLSAAIGRRIERFKPGKDAGVDGRFFSDDGHETIIQCKHYLKSGYKALIAVAKKEAVKLAKLKPTRYIFVTSLPLSRKNKIEIKSIFSPYIKSDNNIFGQEDLNDILAQNPRIEEKHFKLWIASTNVLDRIINNAIKGRSEYEIERIRRSAGKYVVTRNHNEALRILDENNVLIISGEPGIGKTTLAENICLHYVANGYMFVDIEDDLSEAEQVYRQGEKQIFYFDDFLGSNYFEAIENKKDSHIMKFVERVKHDKLKKFILTSRTNILNTGIIHSNILNNKKIRKDEFLLVIQSLKSIDRARILYNHIWFSNLGDDFIEEIYKDKRYRDIIRHKNFNPRLIEFITDIDRINVPASKYWEFIVKTLDNPKDIWSNTFKVQSNVFVRNLVMLTVFNGGQILENDLRYSFNELTAIENIKNPSHTEKDFTLTAQMAVRSFLNRARTFWGIRYSLFNPSIADFILSEYCRNTPKLLALYKSLNTVASLRTLISLDKDDFISTEDLSKILDALFIYSFEKEKNIDYLIFISHLLADDVEKKGQILKFLKQVISSPMPIEEFDKFINLLTKFRHDLYFEDLNFLLVTFENRGLEYYELMSLINFLEYHKVDDKNILNVVAEQIENYLADNIDQIIDDVDLSYYEYTPSPISDDDIYIGLDFDSLRVDMESPLQQIVEEIIDDNSYIGTQLVIDFDSVTSAMDEDSILQGYLVHFQCKIWQTVVKIPI